MRKFTSTTKKEELQKMKDASRRLRYLTIVQLVFCVAALITALLKFMVPSVLCLAAMLLFRLTIQRKAQAAYQQTITDAALACSLGPKLDQFELSAKGGTGLSPEDIQAAELIPVQQGASNTIGLYQGIRGTVKGMELSLNDTTIQLPRLAGDKKVDVICGIWMHFSLQKDTGRNIRILAKELLPGTLRKEFFKNLPSLKRQGAAEDKFHESLFVYDEVSVSDAASVPAESTGTPEDSVSSEIPGTPEGSGSSSDHPSPESNLPAEAPAFQPLPAPFISGVDRLMRKNPGSVALSVQGNTINIFIKDRILSPNYRTNAEPDERFLQLDPLPEFREILNLVNTL